jgi:outer membrane protein assembly factor BamB
VNENDDVLAAIDLSTGDVKWTIQLPANKSYSKSQVIYDKETDSFLIAAGYIIGAINGDSGKYTWKTAAPEFQCKQLKSDRENAYCSTSYNGIEAFNKKTGQRNWIQFLQGYGVADMTLDKDQSLLALKSYDLYRINPNREQLTTKLKICEDNYCFAISGNNNDQKFYFYDDEKLKAVHLKFLK